MTHKVVMRDTGKDDGVLCGFYRYDCLSEGYLTQQSRSTLDLCV